MFFWKFISTFIIRYKIYFLVGVSLLTVFFGYHARKARMSYNFSQVLPPTDTAYKVFHYFEKTFGNDYEVMVIGVEDDKFWQIDRFRYWYSLSEAIDSTEGVENVLSVSNLYILKKDPLHKKFHLERLINRMPETQQELDSFRKELFRLPFYEDYLYTKEGKVNLMAIGLNKKLFNSEDRLRLLEKVMQKIYEYEKRSGNEVHISGLPYIRASNTLKVREELNFFLILATLVTACILFFFFRSFRIIVITLVSIGVAIVFGMGLIALLGYEITILTGLVPPLLIVIGMPNAIYLINRYHKDYVAHGNKILSLSRVIERVGKATFLTNATTAMGFATFVFTKSSILVEFGVVASLCVILLFFLTLTLLPIFLSMFEDPKSRHVKHLNFRFFNSAMERVEVLVTKHRRKIYFFTIIYVAIAIIGSWKIKTAGKITDDLPEEDEVILDLQFFERYFNGVLPLEVLIDTQKKKGAIQLKTLKKIESFNKEISQIKEFSRPISIVEGVKFLKQSFYNGNPDKYALLNSNEVSFIMPYLKNAGKSNDLLKTFLDSNQQITRISLRMADIGTTRMNEIFSFLKPKIDSIFPLQDYKVMMTGNSVVFVRGTEYLIHNLLVSIAIAIVVIALLMSLMFYNYKMILISLVPNLIPLISTAAMMGYLGIPLKPSTILVFSIAFGISVDDTIHFLAKFQQELKIFDNIKDATLKALRESGQSMVYTSIILFFGFGIFSVSDFGGTQALGILIAFTLFVAMFTNILLLPSLLLSLDRAINLKALRHEQLFEILDEEEDIDHSLLEIQKTDSST